MHQLKKLKVHYLLQGDYEINHNSFWVVNQSNNKHKHKGAVVAERSYSYNSYIDKTVHDVDLCIAGSRHALGNSFSIELR